MYDIRIFCENIKKIRENKKLSKREMAKLLGISVYSLNIHFIYSKPRAPLSDLKGILILFKCLLHY